MKLMRVTSMLAAVATFLTLVATAEEQLEKPKLRIPEGPFRPDQRIEFTISGIPEAAKPNEPSEIRVDAEITTPAGVKLVVPGFAMHRMESKLVEGRVRFAPAGPWEWHLRYLPPRAGTYEGVVVVTRPSGATRGELFRFSVGGLDRPTQGMVRVAMGNPQALAWDDGSAFIAVGQNLCWYSRGDKEPDPRIVFRRWLDALAANKANCIRLWLGAQWCFGLESKEPYAYNEDAATLLDSVLDLCEARGIAALMCVDHVREFGPAANPQAANYRSDYPYDLRNGGHCETEKDLLTLPAARAQFQAQLRYIVARWGASRGVLAWEFWNEMDCMQRVTEAQCVAWTDVMARYLHGLDPYRHPITTSLGSKVVWDDLWALPSIDLVQYHDYGGRDLYAGKSQVDVYSAAMDKLKCYGKPVLFSEVGLVDNGWGPNPVVRPDASPQAVRDRKGYSFHEALWLPLFTGAASCGMHWWWDSAIDGFDWYPQYKPFAEFVADVPLHKAPLPSVQGGVSEPNLRCFARGNNWGTVAWIWNANDKWQSLVFDRKAPEKVNGAKLLLPEAVAGKFLVQCVDPWTGKTLLKQTMTARASTLTVPLPDFAIDIAVKAIRIGSQQVKE